MDKTARTPDSEQSTEWPALGGPSANRKLQQTSNETNWTGQIDALLVTGEASRKERHQGAEAFNQGAEAHVQARDVTLRGIRCQVG